MEAIVVTDEAAGTAGMTLVERPEPPAAINDVIVQILRERSRLPHRDAFDRLRLATRPPSRDAPSCCLAQETILTPGFCDERQRGRSRLRGDRAKRGLTWRVPATVARGRGPAIGPRQTELSLRRCSWRRRLFVGARPPADSPGRAHVVVHVGERDGSARPLDSSAADPPARNKCL